MSLFSGCGGLDYGFHSAGFQCLGAFDTDPVAVATYNLNFGHNLASCLDLRIRRELVGARPDVVLAGPPCQGFSPAGHFDSGDPRNSLFLVPIQIGIALKAPLIVVENVPGLIMQKHSALWQKATRLLHLARYHVRTQVVDAAELGSPQRRRRVILLASRDLVPPFSPAVSAASTLEAALLIRPGTANHAPMPIPKGSRGWRIAKKIQQGQKLCNVRRGDAAVHTWDIPEAFGRVSARERRLLDAMVVLRRRNRTRDYGDADPVTISTLNDDLGTTADRSIESLLAKGYLREVRRGLYDLRHTFNGKFRRLRANAPSHAVLTKFCDATHFLHPCEHRAFTPREAASVQTFPNDFVFEGSVAQQARIIGNAVPPLISIELAKWAKHALS